MTGCELALACVLDATFGDPRGLPHPVRLMGRMIASYERVARSIVNSEKGLRTAGIVLALGLPALAYGFGWWAIDLGGKLHATVGTAILVFLAYTTLTARDLVGHALSVKRALEMDSLIDARVAASRIVGRDTAELDEPEVVRATVETIAESACDGVIAPLCYLALGGPPLALAYKTVSTLDSMVGYRDARYRALGWAAARLDDVVNWIPARITGVLLVVAAGIWTNRLGQAWRIFYRDGGKHPSPNSGRPEAAMAGALGVQLGGTNCYGGRPEQRPRLGDARVIIAPAHITAALCLMAVASLIAATVVVTVLSL